MADALSPIIQLAKDYSPILVWGLGSLWIVTKTFSVLFSVVGSIKKKRMLARWTNTPKDVIIVHRFPSASTLPNASPFVIKLETYLRMTKIPYEIDEVDFMSVKGKCPWITLNGDHVADSQLCIEYLAKKYKKTVGDYSPQQRAIGTMARIMMDEHFYWGLLLWRYVYTKGRDCHKFYDHYPRLVLSLMLRLLVSPSMASNCVAQGVGRHSKEDVIEIMAQDLRALSAFLGSKPFLLGNEPCEDDAAVFGELAEVVWAMPGSPYETLVNGELKNLKDYCLRMKTTFWPDWEQCLSAAQRDAKKNK